MNDKQQLRQLMNDKQQLRQLMRQRKAACLPTDKEAAALRVAAMLQEHAAFRSVRTILLYHALPDEVPTQALLEALLAQGKTLLLPCVTGSTEMELRRYTTHDDLKPGVFGILEPTGEVFTDDASIDTALIPGMAFDRKGHRLGRGKGYYDRFLSCVPHIYKIGICYPFQLVEEVPADDHDIMVDEVIVVPLQD